MWVLKRRRDHLGLFSVHLFINVTALVHVFTSLTLIVIFVFIYLYLF